MWLSDLVLILPDRVVPRGALRLGGARIMEVAEAPVPGGMPMDGAECWPGLVDMHGDMIEQELEPRPGVDFPLDVALPHLDARLAASGVTTAYAAVSFSRGAAEGGRRSYAHTAGVIRALAAARGALRVDHRVHARFDVTFEGATEVLGDLIAAGTVDLVSLIDHTPGQGQYRDVERHVAKKAKVEGLPPAEARARVAERIAQVEGRADLARANMRAVAALCRERAIPLASHDDDTPEKARMMADLGCTISEFPVSAEAARAAGAHGMTCAMGAPNAMRGASYSGNLSAREAHDLGLLGILAADYHPAAILLAIRILAETDSGGLAGAARLGTANPARAVGLADRGSLAPGLRADLMLTRPGGGVLATVAGGRMVHSDGTLPHLAAVRRRAA